MMDSVAQASAAPKSTIDDEPSQLRLLESLLSIIPPLLSVEAVAPSDSIVGYFKQERERYTNFVKYIRDHLELMAIVVRGEGTMLSSAMDAVFHDIISLRVPQDWTARSFVTELPPVAWAQNLAKRIEY